MDGIETFGSELSEGFIGQGDRFPRVGVGGENSSSSTSDSIEKHHHKAGQDGKDTGEDDADDLEDCCVSFC